MSSKPTRRDFLQVVLETIPAAALSGPLVELWPQEELHRPVAEPYEVGLDEGGYLIDPGWELDEDELPSVRVNRDYDDMTGEEKRDFLLDTMDKESVAEVFGRPVAEFTEQDIELLEVAQRKWLDGPEENLTFEQALRLGPHHVGGEILDRLGWETTEQLGLRLVEGDRPGSDFCGVALDGEIDELNSALARAGLNLVVVP